MRKNKHFRMIFAAAAILPAAVPIAVSAQSGGPFAVVQSVVATGGGRSTDAVNNVFQLEGTAGQTAAGESSSGGQFSVSSGYWQALLSPTAAGASISGRVAGINEKGLAGVTITLFGGNLTSPRVVRTNSFGNFNFEDVEPGQLYFVTATHRKYGFAQPTQTVTLMENVLDMVFQASWEN